MGIEAYIVEVEVDITTGFPSFSTVGLPDAAVKESRERVKPAVVKGTAQTYIRAVVGLLLAFPANQPVASSHWDSAESLP